ncbi:hypothetical protein BGW36DRAFT_388218, partial [Talaromyces proteolyticus]
MNSNQLGPKRSFERDWKEIRQRLERKIAAAAAQAISARPGGGEIRKPRWPLTPQKQKGPRTYEVKTEDKLTKRGANPRTGMISPSNRTDSSREDHVPRPRASQKWKVNGNQWVCVDVSQSPSSISSVSEYKLSKTTSSAGSESTDTSSEGWGDRFVVNMPSAKEPNPPSMTDEEIRLYQEKKGKLHANEIKRHEMDASKSPKSSSAYRNTPHPKKMNSTPVLQKAMTTSSFQTDTSLSGSLKSDGSRHYYSPDEVGQTRVGSLSDEPKLKQKDLYHKLRAECFMGCMGMDQAGAKNPDEVLLFPNLDDEEEERRSPCPAPKSRNTDEAFRRPGKLPVPQASKIPQIAGQRVTSNPHKVTSNIPVISRPTALTIPPALTVVHATRIPKPPTNGSPVERTATRKEEDVFMSASNVPRVALKPITRSTIQPFRTRPPRTLAQKGSTLRHNITTPENDPFFSENSSSETSPTGHPHTTGDEEYRSTSISPDSDGSAHIATQDFAPASDDHPFSAPTSAVSMKLSPSDIFKNIPRRGPPLDEIHSPAKERALNELLVKKQRAKKAPSVAELDGLQVPQQLPSPPLSASPSPPPRSKPRERKGTHTIRMEIRMKAEKARQGAEEAKSASSRLTAARQHAERLAEARAAYDRVKAQSAVKGMRPPMDELREQKLNTERINEARKAYKAAKAKEQTENASEPQKQEAEEKPKSTTAASTSVPRSSKPSVEAKPVRKSRRTGAQRRAPSQTENKSPDDTIDSGPKKKTDTGNSKRDSMPDLSPSMGVLYLSLINLFDFLHHKQIYSDVLRYSQKLPQMALHCFKVCKSLAEAWIEFKETGTLPKSCTDDFGNFAKDIGQALVNFAVLGLVLIVVGRAAGYIVVVASWIVWFCKPFAWVFGGFIGST